MQEIEIRHKVSVTGPRKCVEDNDFKKLSNCVIDTNLFNRFLDYGGKMGNGGELVNGDRSRIAPTRTKIQSFIEETLA